MNDTIEKIMCSLVGVKAPQRKFLLILFTVIMCRVGRANFRNMSRFSQVSEKTFSRWYRRPFDFVTFNTRLLKEEGIDSKPLIAAVDASFLSKSGKSTNGLGYFWNGSSSRSEKGLEVSTVAIVDIQANTAYALNSQQTIPDDGNRVVQYCNQLKAKSASLQGAWHQAYRHRWFLHEGELSEYCRVIGVISDRQASP